MVILYSSFGESYVGICQTTGAIAIPSRLSHQRLIRDNWVEGKILFWIVRLFVLSYAFAHLCF